MQPYALFFKEPLGNVSLARFGKKKTVVLQSNAIFIQRDNMQAFSTKWPYLMPKTKIMPNQFFLRTSSKLTTCHHPRQHQIRKTFTRKQLPFDDLVRRRAVLLSNLQMTASFWFKQCRKTYVIRLWQILSSAQFLSQRQPDERDISHRYHVIEDKLLYASGVKYNIGIRTETTLPTHYSWEAL